MENAVAPRQLEHWIREALRVQIGAAEKAIQKAKVDIESQITSLKEVVSDLLRKSEKDIAEKKDNRAVYKAARAVNRMCTELEGVLTAAVLGNPVGYDGLKQFTDGTSRLAGDAARIRDTWIRYIRPYYILDMMGLNASIDKLRRLGEQAWGILTKEGGLLRGLEEARNRAEKIEDLSASLKKEVEERVQVMSETEKLAPQISEAQYAIESLTVNPKISDLRKIDSRLKELRGELLSSGFRRLGRPLRKLEAMTGRGDYPVQPEVREKLSAYLKRPFTTFISEGEGYPALKTVLGTTRDAVRKRKLVLKQREERKVLERIDNVVDRNTLDHILREAAALVAERRRYLRDPDCLELVRAYKTNKISLKNLQSRHSDFERRAMQLAEKVETLKGSLAQYVRETELFAEKLAKRPVKIELALP